MKISFQNEKRIADNKVYFGAKVPDSDDLEKVIKLVDDNVGGLYTRVVRKIIDNGGEKRLLKIEGNFYPKESKLSSLKNTTFDLIRTPIRVSASLAKYLNKTFPDNGLVKKYYASGHVQNQLKRQTVENGLGALEGAYKCAKKILKEAGAKVTDSNAGELIRKANDEALNKSLRWGAPKYATKDERLLTRLVSGFTSAWFIGKDFENRALMQDKSPEQAKKDREHKVTQEVVANIGEGISQFAFFATFPLLINSKQWMAPLAAAGIGFAFNIISRIATKMPLTKKKISPMAQKHNNLLENLPNEFKQFEIKPKQDIKHADVKNKSSPITFKKILAMCGTSIAAGFALKYCRQKLIPKTIGTKFEDLIGAVNKTHFEDVIATKKEFTEFASDLSEIGEKRLAAKAEKCIVEDGELIGRKVATTKGIEVPYSEIQNMLLAPIRFVVDLVSLPYQKTKDVLLSVTKTKKFEELLNNDKYKKFLKPLNDLLADPEQLVKPYDKTGMANIFFEFKRLKKKYGSDTAGFNKAFRENIIKEREKAASRTTVSKISNEKIAATAQLMGMLAGIGFNMTDDFNKTIDNGGTKEQADKAARLRGLNKITRTSAQVAIAVTLNNALKKYYNTSLVLSSLITFTATVLTDKACRVLLGMPSKTMTKEEQIAHKQKQENGIAGRFYRFIDGLSG